MMVSDFDIVVMFSVVNIDQGCVIVVGVFLGVEFIKKIVFDNVDVYWFDVDIYILFF